MCYVLLLSDRIVIIIFFFLFQLDTASSGVCQYLRVQLQNNALEAQWEREGTYLLASNVNGQPCWISECCGIWYMPDISRWMIGPLESIGLEDGGIESKILGSKLEYPENIVEWNYHTKNGWEFYNGNNDIIIECIDHKDHNKKSKSMLLFFKIIFDPIFDAILTLFSFSFEVFFLIVNLTFFDLSFTLIFEVIFEVFFEVFFKK